MKKKNSILNFAIITVGLLFILCSGCKKDQNANPTNGRTSAIFNPNVTYGTMTDQDGNTYKTVVIGTQTWMAENLRTTKYRNGDPIQMVTDASIWKNLTHGAYCNYNNTTNLDTIATFGRLYNGFVVLDKRNIAPTGWHVPNEWEWNVLGTYWGSQYNAGSQLKEIGTTHWLPPNNDANNESGFTALPAGSHYVDVYVCSFLYFGIEGIWWSTSEDTLTISNSMVLMSNEDGGLSISGYNWHCGISVRCIKE